MPKVPGLKDDKILLDGRFAVLNYKQQNAHLVKSYHPLILVSSGTPGISAISGFPIHCHCQGGR
ncbi:hypothetical protein MMC2321_01633 [Chitinophaga sp. MM2321]